MAWMLGGLLRDLKAEFARARGNLDSLRVKGTPTDRREERMAANRCDDAVCAQQAR